MSEGMALFTMVLSVAFTGVLVEWIARSAHPRHLFFVDLGRERTPADEARARRLRVGNAIVTAAGVALVLVGPDWLALAGVVAPLASTAWLVVELTGAMRSATPAPVPGRWMVSLDAPPSPRAYVSMPLQLANVLVVVVSCALYAWVAARLTDAVPAHWNAAGEVDRWASPSELWSFAGILAFDLALLWGLVFTVAKERWALPERDTERYTALQMDRRRLMVRMLEWLFLAIGTGIALTWLGIAFGSLAERGELLTAIVIAGVLVSLAGTIAPLVIYVPRIMRTNDALRAIAGTAALGTHASGWRFSGMIYYAPHDPAVFVPKRHGLGQTVNFARPAAWIFLAAVVAIPLLLSLFMKR